MNSPVLSLLCAAMLMLGLTTAAQAKEACLIAAKECEALFKPKNAKLLAVMQMSDAEMEQMSDTAAIMGAMQIVRFYEKFDALQAKANARCEQGDAPVSLSDFDRFFVTGEGDHKRALMMRGKTDCAWIKVK